LAEIRPFRGVTYRSREKDLASVLAPPYDVITPAQRDALYARDLHNIVRVVLNRTPGEAGYVEAGETYARWLREGVLVADDADALYVVEQAFSDSGRTLRRVGLLARFRAEDKEKQIILPHEHTRAAAKEDRWRVLNATRANFSPIFLMFPDPRALFGDLVSGAIAQLPLAQFTDDAHVGHRLWRVGEPAAIEAFQALLGGVRSYIADGHHRHATALRYRDAVGPDGAWTLGYFTPMEPPGLLVLPYHRIVAEGPSVEQASSILRAHFRVSPRENAALAAASVARSQARYAFALAEPGGAAALVEADAAAGSMLPAEVAPSLRALDTTFLHHAVLGPLLNVPDSAVGYVHSQAEAEEALSGGRCRLVVLMRATPVQQIVDVADAGESMPAKSTFFHPKLPSGLVVHPLVV
jgi:uncharacterized protein (DUF1015 family)